MQSDSEVAVITGVSTGIGRATLQSLLREGYTVFGRRLGHRCCRHPCWEGFEWKDLSRSHKQCSFFGGGGIPGLSNGTHPMELIPMDKLRYQLEVNLVAPIGISQAFLPLLGTDRTRKGTPGKLIFIGSIYGSYSLPWTGAYCATKHAIEAISETFRIELRPFGIQVVVVRPGPTDSEIWAKNVKGEQTFVDTDAPQADYSTSQYAIAMENTNRAMLAEMSTKGFFLPCHVLGDTICKLVIADTVAARVLKTSNLLINWILPRWLPIKLRDMIISKKLGIY